MVISELFPSLSEPAMCAAKQILVGPHWSALLATRSLVGRSTLSFATAPDRSAQTAPVQVVIMVGTRTVDPDPHLFSLLYPDLEGKIVKINSEKMQGNWYRYRNNCNSKF